jgi:hypothetical protein
LGLGIEAVINPVSSFPWIADLDLVHVGNLHCKREIWQRLGETADPPLVRHPGESRDPLVILMR